jgi:hypothetical protein
LHYLIREKKVDDLDPDLTIINRTISIGLSMEIERPNIPLKLNIHVLIGTEILWTKYRLSNVFDGKAYLR